MRILNKTKTEKYSEVEVEKKFLLWKWKAKYRMVNNDILRYTESGKYLVPGTFELIELETFFKLDFFNKIEQV